MVDSDNPSDDGSDVAPTETDERHQSRNGRTKSTPDAVSGCVTGSRYHTRERSVVSGSPTQSVKSDQDPPVRPVTLRPSERLGTRTIASPSGTTGAAGETE
jgi:hypothetical protein